MAVAKAGAVIGAGLAAVGAGIGIGNIGGSALRINGTPARNERRPCSQHVCCGSSC